MWVQMISAENGGFCRDARVPRAPTTMPARGWTSSAGCRRAASRRRTCRQPTTATRSWGRS